MIITASEAGHIQIRTDEGLRYVLAPGDNLTDQPKDVQDFAAATWTPAIIEDYQQIVAARKARDAAVESVVPASVSARQFKLQLLTAGLLEQVESWVSAQDRAVQIAYANSGTFVRGEPMMQQGFTALGFTGVQIDAFFTEAARL